MALGARGLLPVCGFRFEGFVNTFQHLYVLHGIKSIIDASIFLPLLLIDRTPFALLAAPYTPQVGLFKLVYLVYQESPLASPSSIARDKPLSQCIV
jgi:hypothetical protein